MKRTWFRIVYKVMTVEMTGKFFKEVQTFSEEKVMYITSRIHRPGPKLEDELRQVLHASHSGAHAIHIVAIDYVNR